MNLDLAAENLDFSLFVAEMRLHAVAWEHHTVMERLRLMVERRNQLLAQGELCYKPAAPALIVAKSVSHVEPGGL